MFFYSINFKDSATPFAEALVELHHEIMFYLIVIVSVVIFILVNAINITRVRESYFYSNVFTIMSFFKTFALNSFFLPIFNKFLYSSYYDKLYTLFLDLLHKVIYLISSKGSSYINYFFKFLLTFKSFFLNFFLSFRFLELFVSKLIGDYKKLGNSNLLSNSFDSNSSFYKSRNSTSYLSYLLNLSLYVSLLSLFSDIDYKNFYRNREIFFSYFKNMSQFNTQIASSRSIVNLLNFNSLEDLHNHNILPNLRELNSNFLSFYLSGLKNKFSFNNSIKVYNNKVSYVSALTPNSIYSFINAQSYTVHNTKLEII